MREIEDNLLSDLRRCEAAANPEIRGDGTLAQEVEQFSADGLHVLSERDDTRSSHEVANVARIVVAHGLSADCSYARRIRNRLDGQLGNPEPVDWIVCVS